MDFQVGDTWRLQDHDVPELGHRRKDRILSVHILEIADGHVHLEYRTLPRECPPTVAWIRDNELARLLLRVARSRMAFHR